LAIRDFHLADQDKFNGFSRRKRAVLDGAGMNVYAEALSLQEVHQEEVSPRKPIRTVESPKRTYGIYPGGGDFLRRINGGSGGSRSAENGFKNPV
jgi:hypothetical protein